MNRFLITLFLFSTFVTLTTSCKKKGCTNPLASNYDATAKKEDGTCQWDTVTGHQITLQFSHNYDGTTVTSTDFNDLKYTNSVGNVHSISKLNYLISNFRLYKSNGDSLVIKGHQLVSLTSNGSLTYVVPGHILIESYTGIGFNFGFDATDNLSGAYSDLNIANWSWPASLGGGYHNMQFEGNFITSVPDTISFGYHMGAAREITSIDTVFHNNHFLATFPNSGFTLSNNTTIEIKMNIAEWFKSPNTWDLNTYNSSLMGNYTAQIMMRQNGVNAFSLGAITQ